MQNPGGLSDRRQENKEEHGDITLRQLHDPIRERLAQTQQAGALDQFAMTRVERFAQRWRIAPSSPSGFRLASKNSLRPIKAAASKSFHEVEPAGRSGLMRLAGKSKSQAGHQQNVAEDVA